MGGGRLREKSRKCKPKTESKNYSQLSRMHENIIESIIVGVACGKNQQK